MTATLEPETYDWQQLTEELSRYLRLTATPLGMKMFDTVEAMKAVPGVRRPQGNLLLDQIVGQARWNGWTMGVTADDLGAQCAAPVGLYREMPEFRKRTGMSGVWFATDEDAIAHQEAMDCVEPGRYRALVVSPLATGRLNPPDVCLIYGTPGQMIILVNGLQYRGYRKLEFSAVGESACADSWGRALRTGEPALSIPCFAERRFGGVQDNELLMALPPRYLPKAIEGMAQLSKHGLRYPIAPWGIHSDPAASLARSYGPR